MFAVLMMVEVLAVQIPGAQEWTLARDMNVPYCFAKRQLGNDFVAIHYNAIEGKSSVMFGLLKHKNLEMFNSQPKRIIAVGPSVANELKGLKYVRSTDLENGTDGLLFETYIDVYLERLKDKSSLAAFAGPKMLVLVSTPISN